MKALRFLLVLLTVVPSVMHSLDPRSGALLAQTSETADHGNEEDRGAGGLDPAERLFGLSLIWREAAYNFPYFEHLPELDWDAAYRAAVPRVLEATSTLAYYRELQRFVALLEDGHSRVHLPDSIVGRRPFSSPWVDLEAVSGRPMVANVAVELADSLPVGSEIIAVEGMGVDEHIERRVLPWVFASAPHARRISAIEGSHTRGYGLLVGPAEDPVRIQAARPSGDEVWLTLARDRFRVAREWVHPPDNADGPPLVLAWPAPDVAHLELNTFSNPSVVARLDSVLPQLLGARAVVVDLRRNTGGSDVVAAEVLARFADGPFPGQAWRTRTNDAYYRALGSFGRSALERALPPEDSALVDIAVRHYAGDAWRTEEADTLGPVFEGERVSAPVAILVDRTTASAAENLLLRIPDDGRFVIVGSPTAASTGQPLVFGLPGGGSGQVVTRAVLLADGTPLVKTGVVPDVVVEPTIEDLRAGRDPALERALALLEGR
jgi:C-terminal processing protease CtpA/Prc